MKRHYRDVESGVIHILRKGPFKNYMDKILTIFDYLPTSPRTFFTLNVDKKKYFLTTYQPHLVYVVFERPLSTFLGFLDPPGCMFNVLKINKDCNFLAPLSPTSAYVIYELSPNFDTHMSFSKHNCLWTKTDSCCLYFEAIFSLNLVLFNGPSIILTPSLLLLVNCLL